MKRLLILTSVLFFAGCATTEYVGESYAATSHVDIYFDATDIDRPHKVMGQAKTEATEYMKFELIEQQLVKDAMAKGADAIVIEGMDTIVTGSFSSTSGDRDAKPKYIVTEDGELENIGGDGHYQSFSTTTQVKDNVITAKLIKYTE